MNASRKKLSAFLILLVFLILFGMAGRNMYRELRQPELNAALIAAVKKNDTAATISRLQDGADPNARDLEPDTRSLWERLSDRFRGKPPRTNRGNSVLFVALPTPLRNSVPSENIPLVEALLNAASDVNTVDQHGETILMWAIKTGRPETVRLLLDRGAKVNVVGEYRVSALHYAADVYDPTIIKLLLAHSAFMNARDGRGATPLLWAVRSEGNVSRSTTAALVSNADCVKLLLANDAQVNTKDDYGDTPLKVARENDNALIVKMLKKAGAKE
jgi:ankyrin repeat protein